MTNKKEVYTLSKEGPYSTNMETEGLKQMAENIFCSCLSRKRAQERTDRLLRGFVLEGNPEEAR